MDKQESIGKKWNVVRPEKLKYMCYILESERNSFKSANKRLKAMVAELEEQRADRNCCGNCNHYDPNSKWFNDERCNRNGRGTYMNPAPETISEKCCEHHSYDGLNSEQRGK